MGHNLGSDDSTPSGVSCAVTKLYRHDCHFQSCPSRWARFADNASEQSNLEALVRSEPIVHRHQYNQKTWDTESFTVNDAAMRTQLKAALAGYQDFDPELQNWTFKPPYEPLVHRLDRLEALCLDDASDAEGRAAVKAFMEFLRPILAPSIEALAKTKDTGKVLFKDVWHIYPPGEVAVTKFYGVEAAARVVRYEKKIGMNGLPSWEVELEYVDWNGAQSGYTKTIVNVGSFAGYKFATSLVAYPLSFCADAALVRARLTERGRRFERLRGYHFQSCQGTKILLETPQPEERPVSGRVIVDAFAYFSSNNVVKPVLRSLTETEEQKHQAGLSSRARPAAAGADEILYGTVDQSRRGENPRQNSHVVAPQRNFPPLHTDPWPIPSTGQTYMSEPAALPYFQDFQSQTTMGMQQSHSRYGLDVDGTGAVDTLAITKNSDGAAMTAMTLDNTHGRKEDLEPLSDYHCLLATPWLRGLDLKTKDWAMFNISELSEITWNDEAFDRLVLPGNEKDLAWQFVENKRLANNDFDDFIAAKGRGIIILMFGPPGVGKTATAEAVSERARAPLYAVSAASLGTAPADVEAALERALELCRLWGAILLLDEADVFLAARTDRDVARNELVAVFLTKLEYYQGVCFLTTNRIRSLDHAFQSRIDLFLAYDDLTPASRRQVWKNFMARADGNKFDVDEAGLDTLALIPVNGREIKNLIKSAHLLSLKGKQRISLASLQTLAENRIRALKAISE